MNNENYKSYTGKQWCEALSVGNGKLGGMIYGGCGQEIIKLSEDSIWSGLIRMFFPAYRIPRDPISRPENAGLKCTAWEKWTSMKENWIWIPKLQGAFLQSIFSLWLLSVHRRKICQYNPHIQKTTALFAPDCPGMLYS